MKKTIFIIGLLLSMAGNYVLAQEVKYSSFDKFDLRTGDFSVVGKVGDKIYVYRAGNEGYFLDAYDDTMQKAATVLLDFFPKKIYETRFINYPDKIVVLYQSVESNKVIQYAALLDAQGRLQKNPMKLIEFKTGIFGPNKNYFTTTISDDKSQILITGIEAKSNNLQLSGVWLDEHLTIAGRSVARFAADNTIAYSEGVLDDKGNFYLPVFTPYGSKNYADQYWLLRLPKLSNKFSVTPFALSGKYVANSFLKMDNANNRLYIGGFYSDKKNGSFDGVMYGNYSTIDTFFTQQKLLSFHENLRMATGERSRKRAFDNFQVRQMIVKKEGGFVLLAEDVSIVYRQSNPGWGGYYSYYYYTPMMSQTIKEYYYDDILALSYNAEGQNEWYSFIRKNQYSQEDGGVFSSYALLNSGGALGFLFNDFNTRRSQIQLATLDGSGKTEMRSLAAGTASDPDWLPRSAKQTGIREIIIPCLKRKQIGFAKLVFH